MICYGKTKIFFLDACFKMGSVGAIDGAKTFFKVNLAFFIEKSSDKQNVGRKERNMKNNCKSSKKTFLQLHCDVLLAFCFGWS